jgi:AraC-like DNA-binding protein
MDYFGDLQFVDGAIRADLARHIDVRRPAFFCFMFIPEGPIYFSVDGGRRSVLRGPHAFWHHPKHTYQYGPGGESWHHNWVSFRGARAQRFVEQGLMPLSASGFVRVSRPAVFAEAFRRLVPIVHRRDPFYHPRGVLILENLLSMLLSDARRQPETTAYHRELGELDAAIREDPYQKIDFRLEARRMGLSYSHFRRVFRLHAGKSPHAYLLRWRMQRAARELRETDRQVKEIALEAGYGDPAQFCKIFKQKIGFSPGRFRASML